VLSAWRQGRPPFGANSVQRGRGASGLLSLLRRSL
jgi:hypothetical protein